MWSTSRTARGIRAGLEEDPDELRLAEGSGRDERRPAVIVRLVELGARTDQLAHALRVIVERGRVERCHAIFTTPVRIVLVFVKQSLQRLGVAFVCRLEEREAAPCACIAQREGLVVLRGR